MLNVSRVDSWIASDGTVFPDRRDAEKHEATIVLARMYNEWNGDDPTTAGSIAGFIVCNKQEIGEIIDTLLEQA